MSNGERKPDRKIELIKIILAGIFIIVTISRARKLKILFLRMTDGETFLSRIKIVGISLQEET